MYCTKQDMVDRYGEDELIQLTDRTGSGEIDDTVLDRARTDADAEIDGYLTIRYQLPLAEVPPVLVRVACDIARWHLHDDEPTDAVKTRYDNAVRWLRDVAGGKVELLRPEGTTAETSATAAVAEFDGGRHVFSGGGW